MLLNKLRNARNDEGGFTLIELLVVILIIGILAAIALPTFLGQSDKAKDSSAKSDARNAITQIESCMVDAAFGACDAPAEAGFASSVTATAVGDGYTVAVTSDSGNEFEITKAGTAPGGYTYECTTVGEGGCPADGNWGPQDAVVPAT